MLYENKSTRITQLVVIISTFLLSIPTSTQAMHSTIQVSATPSWLVPSAYAQYSATETVSLWRYDESLTPNNGYLALYNDELLEASSVNEFHYRWEVVSLSDQNITLCITVNAIGWQNWTFILTLDSDDFETIGNETSIGFSRFWFTQNEWEKSIKLFTNPVIGFLTSSYSLNRRSTIQGLQESYDVTGEEENYTIQSRGPFKTSLGYDRSTGLLITMARRIILPFPNSARLILLGGILQLTATNIDLGPDILLPDYGSLFVLAGIVVAIIVLTTVFYVARRKARKKEKQRIIRRKKKSQGSRHI